MGRAEYQNMKHTNCHIYHAEAVCDPVNPPHSDPKTVKPWIQNNLASPTRDCLETQRPGTASQRSNVPCPPCTALKCLFISICVVSSGFQAESVVCPLPLLTSLILQGKLSPGPRGISMHNVKHGFHEGRWLLPTP